MRFALISDIHSNADALARVLEDIDRKKIDRIFCLGDIVGYGPDPEFCVDKVRERCEFSLLGNHEHGAMFYASDFNPRARAAIDWTRDQLSRRDCPREENTRFWNYLDSMKKEHREGHMLFVHGSPRDPVREYLVPRDVTDKQKMDLVMTVGQYTQVSMMLNSFGVQLDPGQELDPALDHR